MPITTTWPSCASIWPAMHAPLPQSDYAQATLDQLPHGPSGDRPGKWFWGPARLVDRQPAKIEVDHDAPALRIGPDLKQMIDGSSSRR